MHKFLLISPFFVCFVFIQNACNIIRADQEPQAAYDLSEFIESAEEFTEQFTSEPLEIDRIPGCVEEFLEHSFPVPHQQEPSLIQIHLNNITALIPGYSNQKEFYQKAERITPSADKYSLLLPHIFYHPPQS